MQNNIFKGVLTALITPFKMNKIDYSSLRSIIEMQIDSNIKSIIVGGSTGEGNSLSSKEYCDLLEYSTDIGKDRINIIAAVSTVSTDQAIEKINQLEKIKIKGLMCTVPHYVIPNQLGIYKHFEKIHDNTSHPMMIYIHPKRTGVDIEYETIEKLSKLERITAIKDAGENLMRPLRVLNHVKNDFSMLTGNDTNILLYNAHGGSGVVSVISNLIPDIMIKLQRELDNGNYQEARLLQTKLLPLYDDVFNEQNPIGVKIAMKELGIISSDEVRMPLIRSSNKSYDKIHNIIKLIKS